jgi:hypothetical protein
MPIAPALRVARCAPARAVPVYLDMFVVSVPECAESARRVAMRSPEI